MVVMLDEPEHQHAEGALALLHEPGRPPSEAALATLNLQHAYCWALACKCDGSNGR